MVVLCAARGVARFDPGRRFGELFGNFAQKLRRTLFRFRRDLLLDETLHAIEFFVDAPAKILEILDTLKPRELFVDALAELFELVHKCQIL